jgi:FixJ family two-component response regulator
LPGFVHIVDDDASFRTAMERRLKHAGYEVATYASAKHLLDRLPSDSVLGCVLLDVRIPGLSGPELQARLSDLGSTLPIIFVTGHPDIPTTVQAIKAGADDFLIKPVSSNELLQAVERAIAHHNANYRLKRSLDVVRSHIATLTPREQLVEYLQNLIEVVVNLPLGCFVELNRVTLSAMTFPNSKHRAVMHHVFIENRGKCCS